VKWEDKYGATFAWEKFQVKLSLIIHGQDVATVFY